MSTQECFIRYYSGEKVGRLYHISGILGASSAAVRSNGLEDKQWSGLKHRAERGQEEAERGLSTHTTSVKTSLHPRSHDT